MNDSNTPAPTFLGLRKLPARYAGLVMPLLLSILMTCIVSLISTFKGVGWVPHFWKLWLGAWAVSWLVAFPALLVALPLVRKLTAALVDVNGPPGK